MDKVNILYRPQGHSVKVNVTKVITVFLTIFANITVLTVLMTLNLNHIHKIGRYGQGQYPIWIPRSQGQGHEGHFLFLYARS